jgi:DNA-directed RNA polymerase sigma subunit (sigma70/sigma32)
VREEIVILRVYYSWFNNLENSVDAMLADDMIESSDVLFPMKFEEIGYVMGITRQRVHQIYLKAMKKIKKNKTFERIKNDFY